MKRMSLLVVALLALGCFLLWQDDVTSGPPSNRRPPASTTRTSAQIFGTSQEVETPEQKLGQKLAQAGWTPDARQGLLALAQPSVPALLAEPLLMESVSRLWQQRELRLLLSTHPETAGFLAASQRPRDLADSLLSCTDVRERELLISTCLVMRDTQALDAWVQALASQKTLTLRLLSLAPLNFVRALVVYDRTVTPVANDVYDRWLAGWLLQADGLLVPEPELSSRLKFALDCALALRAELQVSPHFRERFIHELWPKASNILARQAAEVGKGPVWHIHGAEPALWKLLQHQNGMELFEKHNLYAATLLYGGQAVPAELREPMAAALLANNLKLVAALQEFQGNADFLRLCRSVSAPSLEGACNILFTLNARDQQRRLKDWIENTDSITDDLTDLPIWTNLPGGTALNTLKRGMTGRRVGLGEVGKAIWDTYEAIETGVTFGAGTTFRKVVKATLFNVASSMAATKAEEVIQGTGLARPLQEAGVIVNLNGGDEAVERHRHEGGPVRSTAEKASHAPGLVHATMMPAGPGWESVINTTGIAASSKPGDLALWRQHVLACGLSLASRTQP